MFYMSIPSRGKWLTLMVTFNSAHVISYQDKEVEATDAFKAPNFADILEGQK